MKRQERVPPTRSTPIPDRPKVFFDIQIGKSPAFRLVFELFYKELPKTCLNFLYLCTGEAGKTTDGSTNLHYLNSRFHRVITKFMAQGGDFTNFNGTGGESIYGAKFNDEAFPFNHTETGMLSMANAGPNTNGSQFFITFIPCDWLDGKHMVFGRMIEGKEHLKTLEAAGSAKGPTTQPVTVVGCGELA